MLLSYYLPDWTAELLTCPSSPPLDYELYQDKDFPYLALHSQLLRFFLALMGPQEMTGPSPEPQTIHFICFYTYPLTMNLSGCFIQLFPLKDFFNSIIPALTSFLECQEIFWGQFVPVFKGYV